MLCYVFTYVLLDLLEAMNESCYGHVRWHFPTYFQQFQPCFYYPQHNLKPLYLTASLSTGCQLTQEKCRTTIHMQFSVGLKLVCHLN